MTLTPQGQYRHLLLSLFLFCCFVGVFFTYYKPNLSWLLHLSVPVSTHNVCTDECLNAMMENLTQSLTRTSNCTKPSVMQENEENHEPDTIMLIWYWPFGYKFDVNACSPRFGIKGCQITDDRGQYDKAHGVMFHHKDIRDDFTNLLNTLRPPHQKWVWMNMESPDNSGRDDKLDDLFNVTTNYRSDSDVWVPYGRLVKASEKDKPFEIPPKDKIACWIVSNWNPSFKRVQYFNELSKHVKIEAYGRHFNRYVNDEEYNKILPSCKFYLAFENSIHKDYFTEKLFVPLTAGTVPVVIGPPRENYEEFIPAGSFIHVDDFKSPKELAEYLIFLDQNQEMYKQYFTWRQHFTVESSFFALEHACRSCDHIRKHNSYRVFKNLNKWYWG